MKVVALPRELRGPTDLDDVINLLTFEVETLLAEHGKARSIDMSMLLQDRIMAHEESILVLKRIKSMGGF